jgi:hypothetical protein
MQSKKLKENNMFRYLLNSVYVGLISGWNMLRKEIFCHEWEIAKLDNSNTDNSE